MVVKKPLYKSTEKDNKKRKVKCYPQLGHQQRILLDTQQQQQINNHPNVHDK